MLEKPQHVMTLISLLLVIVIDTMGVGLILPVITPLFFQTQDGILSPDTSFAVRNILYAMVISGYSLAMFFGAPLLGDFSDNVGRKKILILCMLGTGLTLAIAGFGVLWHSVAALIMGRFLGGFISSTQPIAQAVIADISEPENKAANMGLMVFAACVGFVIGPMIGGYFANPNLVSWFNSSTPFFVAVLLSLLNTILLALFFQETYQPPTHKKLQFNKAFTIFFSAFKHPTVRLLATVLLLMELGFAIHFVYITLYLVKIFHYNTAMLGHFMTYLGLIWAVTFLILVRIAARLSSLRHLILFGLIIMSASFALCIIKSELVLWLVTIPLAIFNGLTYTALLAMLSDSVDENSQGWVMGISTAVIAAAWAIGSLLAGALSSLGINLPFISAAIVTLIGFILLFLNKNQTKI